MSITITDVITNIEKRYWGNLEKYFKILFGKASNVHAPYHNMNHTLHVVSECYAGACYYVFDGVSFRNLLIAALFHDFNHSGQLTGNDDLEIERAIRGLRKHILPEDEPRLAIIEGLIRSTRFPHKAPNDELVLSEQVLRDADMSQSFGSNDWVQQILFGLSAEMRMTPKELLGTQESFLSGVEFASEWGRRKFSPLRDKRILEVRELVRIIG